VNLHEVFSQKSTSLKLLCILESEQKKKEAFYIAVTKLLIVPTDIPATNF
jgi:hypothetical protein